jgi:hypothetical protein
LKLVGGRQDIRMSCKRRKYPEPGRSKVLGFIQHNHRVRRSNPASDGLMLKKLGSSLNDPIELLGL